MSEEMNLYKRCKNIFKAHGVDMGGGSGDETGAYIVTFTHKGETYTADKTVDEIYDVWYNKHLPVYAFIDNCMLPAVTVGRFDVMFGASGIGRTIEGSGPAINTVRLDNTDEVFVEFNELQRRLKAGDGITLENDPHSSNVIISSTSGGGESGIVFVNLTIDAEDPTAISADKTITELVDAYFSGRMVSVNLEDGSGITSIPLYSVTTSPDKSLLLFGHLTFQPEIGNNIVVMVKGKHDQSGDEWHVNS